MTLALDGTAAAAWQALTEVVSHRRHVLWLDNFSYLDVSPDLLQGPKQVTDAWLAELTRRKKGKLATLDEALAALHFDVAVLVP
jgi:predicted nucleic acid-binding protein